MSEKEITLAAGKNDMLKTTVFPKNAGNKKLKWTSSDEKVAKVTAGKVTAVAEGKAVITAMSCDGSEVDAECIVYVTNPVKKITLSEKQLSIAPGTSWKIEAAIEPDTATDKTVEWSSSNEAVAVVQNGTITGIAPGKCKIVCRSADGSGKKTELNLNVKDYDIVIASPGKYIAEFKTTNWSSTNTFNFGGLYISEKKTYSVNVKNACVKTEYDNVLLPVKPGEDIIKTVLKLNGEIIEKESYTVFVAPSAIEVSEEQTEKTAE